MSLPKDLNTREHRKFRENQSGDTVNNATTALTSKATMLNGTTDVVIIFDDQGDSYYGKGIVAQVAGLSALVVKDMLGGFIAFPR